MHVPDNFLLQFSELHEACIDASSLIYAQKAGFLAELQHALTLYTVSAVLAEAGISVDSIHLICAPGKMLPPDGQLIQCALARQLPVISEDKHILLTIKRAGLPYYNALMMLNWLFFKDIIDQAHYEDSLRSLHTFARYSEKVWQYGAAVHKVIQKHS